MAHNCGISRALAIAVLLSPAISGAQVDARIARGKYIVDRVAMCGDCHTPHDEQGAPLRGKDLQGARLDFEPITAMPWVAIAPAIAGLPDGLDEGQLANLLETGLMPNGRRLGPPMPQFRMTSADASAVAAYLKFLTPRVGVGGAGEQGAASGPPTAPAPRPKPGGK